MHMHAHTWQAHTIVQLYYYHIISGSEFESILRVNCYDNSQTRKSLLTDCDYSYGIHWVLGCFATKSL